MPVDEVTKRVKVETMSRMISSRTVMLVGSAPQFPHGSMDNIQDIAALGVRYAAEKKVKVNLSQKVKVEHNLGQKVKVIRDMQEGNPCARGRLPRRFPCRLHGRSWILRSSIRLPSAWGQHPLSLDSTTILPKNQCLPQYRNEFCTLTLCFSWNFTDSNV